jgi:hypothetical protein
MHRRPTEHGRPLTSARGVQLQRPPTPCNAVAQPVRPPPTDPHRATDQKAPCPIRARSGGTQRGLMGNSGADHAPAQVRDFAGQPPPAYAIFQTGALLRVRLQRFSDQSGGGHRTRAGGLSHDAAMSGSSNSSLRRMRRQRRSSHQPPAHRGRRPPRHAPQHRPEVGELHPR